MTREQAINYLFSCGFTNEQVCDVVRALTYEPTTKNDLALIHTEGLDEEIRCTMCTNHMKSDRGCDGSCVVNKDMYKAVMDAIEKRIQPTTKNNLGVDITLNTISFKEMMDKLKITAEDIENAEDLEYSIEPLTHPKNDLGVDCINRQAVIDLMMQKWGENFSGDDAMQESIDAIRVMPSVTPQLSVPEVTALAEWTEKLTKECEEAYNKGYADGMKAQEPKTGHWILDETDNSITCDKCGCLIWANDISNGETYYCPNCGAKMEVEE